jgi:hypothetical protein
MASSEEGECRHGIIVLDQERLAVFKDYIDRMDKVHLESETRYQNGEQTQVDFQVNYEKGVKQFWSEPKHARLIDAETIRACFACATIEALAGNLGLARKFSMLGTILKAWSKLGNAFVEGLDITTEGPNLQIMLDFQASMSKMVTDRGFFLYLAKQIPCSCLDEKKRASKQAPRTGRCSYCLSEDLKVELRKCSQCKSAEYCSKKCQVADWRETHKRDCQGIKERHENQAVLKGLARR